MEELKMKLFEIMKKKGLEVNENTSYFKFLNGKSYYIGGRAYKKYIRIWIKARLDLDVEKDFPKDVEEPVYNELHKGYQWISYDVTNEEELNKALEVVYKHPEILMFNLNKLNEPPKIVDVTGQTEE